MTLPWNTAMKAFVGGVLLLALLLYAAVLVWMYTQQERILFHPTQLPPDHRFTLPDVAEVEVPVEGGHLSALHFRQPHPKGLIFFLHGNAGDLSIWFTSTDFYRRVGYDVFMIDYRGYGKSPGRIESEAQLHADVRTAWDFIAPQYAGQKKVIYGRSLGTGLAAHLAAEVPNDLLVLVTPYSSVRDATREAYPWVPLALLRYPLRTDVGLLHARSPAIILHAELDKVFPLAHSQRLQATKPGVELVTVPGAGHTDIHQFDAYTEALARRLGAL